MRNHAVTLGLPGDLIDACSSHYTTKAGGLPVFPGDKTPIGVDKVACKYCRGSMQLIMQAYAPLSVAECAAALPERVLYVFACLQGDCERIAGAFRAFRCQLAPAPARKDQDTHPAGCQSISPGWLIQRADAEQSAAQDESRTSQDSWQHLQQGWASTPADDGLFDFSDLHDQLTAALHVSATDNRSAAAEAEAHPQSTAEMQLSSCCWPEQPALPQFYILASQEPPAAPASGSCNQAHIKQLLQRYHEEHCNSATVSGKDRQMEEANWAGESYEKDSLQGTEAAFLKYDRQLQRCPEQCARYRFGDTPLWPTHPLPAAPSCPGCGGETACELQVMPALISIFEEAHSWIANGLSEDTVLAVPQGWEWVTVAVWTCTSSCQGHDRLAWIEQPVAVAYES